MKQIITIAAAAMLMLSVYIPTGAYAATNEIANVSLGEEYEMTQVRNTGEAAAHNETIEENINTEYDAKTKTLTKKIFKLKGKSYNFRIVRDAEPYTRTLERKTMKTKKSAKVSIEESVSSLHDGSISIRYPSIKGYDAQTPTIKSKETAAEDIVMEEGDADVLEMEKTGTSCSTTDSKIVVKKKDKKTIITTFYVTAKEEDATVKQINAKKTVESHLKTEKFTVSIKYKKK